jgi:inner membrane protein
MNRTTHLLTGAVLFLLYAYFTGFLYGSAGGVFVPGMAGAALGSLLPDMLEPARNARHRGFFHSRKILKLAVVVFLLTFVLGLPVPGGGQSPLLFALSCFTLGYAAHLLADSVTRAGLPG